MPNWVKNQLSIHGDKKTINELLAKCKTSESDFDFNSIIPMPDDVDWYSWSIDNWGTKWNTCEVYVDPMPHTNGAFIEFDTAWSTPLPIFKELKKQYPSLDFEVKYADEDLGYNCGIIIDGTPYDVDKPLHFALNIWNYDEDEIAEMYGEDFDIDEWEETHGF